MCQNDYVNNKLIIFITLILGLVMTLRQVVNSDKERREALLEHTRIVASTIDPKHVLELMGDETDVENQTYQQIKKQLTQVSDVVADTRYVYIMAKRADKTVILVDTQPTQYGLEGLATPGELYDEMDEDVESVLRQTKDVTTKPYTDKWGTFVSGLVSIADGDNVVALVGIDHDIATWNKETINVVLRQLFMYGIIIFIEFVLLSFYRQLESNQKKTAYLATVLESSNDAIYSTDFEKKVLVWNLGAEKLYGYTADEALGREIVNLIVPEDKIEELESKLALIKQNRKVGHWETIRKHKSGRLMTVELIASPVYDQLGKVDSVSFIASDITLQKKKQEEILKYNRDLEKMNKLMIDREMTMIELKKKLKTYELKNK